MNSPHNQQPTRQMTDWLNEPVDQPPTRPSQCLPSPSGEPPRADTPLRYPDFAGFRKGKSSNSGTRPRPRAGLKTRSVTQPRLDSEGRIWKYNSTPWSAYEDEVLRQAAARGTSWYATMTLLKGRKHSAALFRQRRICEGSSRMYGSRTVQVDR
jgi:hypothetical protein